MYHPDDRRILVNNFRNYVIWKMIRFFIKLKLDCEMEFHMSYYHQFMKHMEFQG